ncbi:dimerization domain protein, hAT family, partial [Cooperia oncophora]
LDRHIILDIIECNGNYNAFHKCDLPTVRPADRGYPILYGRGWECGQSRRKDAILLSMYSLQKYCPLIGTRSISETVTHFHNFYDSIAEKVRALDEWPNDLRKDKNSIRFYQALLNNSDALKIPLVVRQAIKCVLVIPASNADPERSFSAATRLTQSDRNSLGTKSIDALMRVQRDGPSLLTVRPKNLAKQWLNPLPGLQAGRHKPSSLARSDIDGRSLVEHSVTQYMKDNRLRGRRDFEAIVQSRRELETSRTMIFSSGIFYDNIH